MHISTVIGASAPWLTILVALPALAGALVGGLRTLRAHGRQIALAVSLVELILAIVAAASFDWSQGGAYQLVESATWIPQLGITWSLGVTALGLVMILLATALVPLVLVAAWHEDANESQAGGYAAWVLALEAFMVVIFAAFDLALFYIAFEAMLVPLYFLIGRYGSGERPRRAALKFLLYSLAGGLVMLGGVVALYALAPGTRPATFFRLDTLAQITPGLSSSVQLGVFLTFFIAFAVKAPMVPVHTWLPDTAAAARPGTSVLLVGVLDKVGTFGMITLCLRLFPGASNQAGPVISVLAVISIVWGSLAAIGQRDVMRLVSFTSVAHFGFMVLGIFVGSPIALTGAMFYMVAHGISIAALFLISGFLTERGGSREISAYRGMQRVTPVIAGTWLVAGLATIALPGLSGFVPEYLVLVGTYRISWALAVFSVLGVIAAALYILLPYQKIFTGPPKAETSALPDMNGREKCVVAPLIAAMLVLGIWSAPLVGSLTPIAGEAAQAFGPVPQAGSTVSTLIAADEGSTK